MSSQPNHQADLPWQPLLVKAAGACCAVGYNLAAASCALRAGMDHFQESEFVDRASEPLKVARLPLGDLWGPKRLAQIVRLAVTDCARTAGGIDPVHTALFLLAAEKGRPHTESGRYHEIFHAVEEECRARFHEASVIIPKGRAGIADALQHAHRVLAENRVRQVLLVGADSYLSAAVIEHYLGQERLLCSSNSDGFIPGEGAAALLLQLPPANAAGLHVLGLGAAQEQATPAGEVPNRAFGLTQAIRQACAQAGLNTGALDFRLTDLNGEQYFAKEMANACTRVMGDDPDASGLPMLHLADGVGETGAAAPVLALAYLSRTMERDDGPGSTGLLHFGNDDGRRAALVAQYR